jgi:uncharacterized protein YegL
MEGEKAKESSDASLALTNELAQPANKDGFSVAVVDFAGKAKVVHNLTKATDLNTKMRPLSVDYLTGGTNITAALKETIRILEAAERNRKEGVTYLRPVAFLFSDGDHNTGPGPHDVGITLKQKADLVTVAFGSDADEKTLRDLASSPQHFYRCSNGRELRSFLAAAGETLTATMAAGKNATQALTMIQQ